MDAYRSTGPHDRGDGAPPEAGDPATDLTGAGDFPGWLVALDIDGALTGPRRRDVPPEMAGAVRVSRVNRPFDSPDRIDVAPAGVSRASALVQVRTRCRGRDHRDDRRARCHRRPEVIVELSVLRPVGRRRVFDTNTEIPAALVEAIRTQVGRWTSPEGRASIRVSLAGPGPTPTTCEVWAAAPGGRWIYLGDLHAGMEASMRDLGRALALAGYAYPLTPEGLPAWQADRVETTTYTLDVTRT